MVLHGLRVPISSLDSSAAMGSWGGGVLTLAPVPTCPPGWALGYLWDYPPWVSPMPVGMWAPWCPGSLSGCCLHANSQLRPVSTFPTCTCTHARPQQADTRTYVHTHKGTHNNIVICYQFVVVLVLSPSSPLSPLSLTPAHLYYFFLLAVPDRTGFKKNSNSNRCYHR